MIRPIIVLLDAGRILTCMAETRKRAGPDGRLRGGLKCSGHFRSVSADVRDAARSHYNGDPNRKVKCMTIAHEITVDRGDNSTWGEFSQAMRGVRRACAGGGAWEQGYMTANGKIRPLSHRAAVVKARVLRHRPPTQHPRASRSYGRPPLHFSVISQTSNTSPPKRLFEH